MKSALYLAWKSILWHRGRSLTIIAAIAIMIWLPVTVRLTLNQFREEITARADSTPLLAGARGSRIDLTLKALYFESAVSTDTTMSIADEVTASNLGIVIPLHIRHRSEGSTGNIGAAIVGTSPEYFEFRKLQIAKGEFFAMLGECVIGANVAERMNLQPGDSVLSANQNTLDLAGHYPLKLNITGVLARSHSADDNAIFTDIRTTWVIDGIGHGHQEVDRKTDPQLVLSSEDSNTVRANAGVLPYTEITESNLDSFHFHGDPKSFPVTAAVIVPRDEKSRVLILGRFASASQTSQCVSPADAISELLRMVFRIEQVVWACSVAAAVVTLLLLGLILTLTMRLRASEMLTMFRIGGSRATISMLLVSELLILVGCSILIAGSGSLLTAAMGAGWIRNLLF